MILHEYALYSSTDSYYTAGCDPSFLAFRRLSRYPCVSPTCYVSNDVLHNFSLGLLTLPVVRIFYHCTGCFNNDEGSTRKVVLITIPQRRELPQQEFQFWYNVQNYTFTLRCAVGHFYHSNDGVNHY